ncbi:hypothetical protein SmJEL517_g04938 [Synchytrium microbalum]|uniref:Uncharacterized protein n=1 Tax=Synchytrium microbalum TaxID=1806994 RepID=A0A507C1M5_9FUNG|nr:uncharacterized protein SmJEL517_g04938 [Synchytrium microbalum]TPX31846.1 hypothetical protein SmJEL517_g04938 [Synchytrium microbalum]
MYTSSQVIVRYLEVTYGPFNGKCTLASLIKTIIGSGGTNSHVLVKLETEKHASANSSRFERYDWLIGCKVWFSKEVEHDVIPTGCYELLESEQADLFLRTHERKGSDVVMTQPPIKQENDIYHVMEEALALVDSIPHHKIETTPILQKAYEDAFTKIERLTTTNQRHSVVSQTAVIASCVKILIELYQVSQATFDKPEKPPAPTKQGDPSTASQFEHPSRFWRAGGYSPNYVYLNDGQPTRTNLQHKLRMKFYDTWLHTPRVVDTADVEKILQESCDSKPRLGDSKEWVKPSTSPIRTRLRHEYHLDQ